MEHFSAGLLRIDVKESTSGGPIELLWSGRSTDRNPAKLFGPFLTEALTLAESRGVSLELHFEKLEYFNSATISSILTILHDAQRRKVKIILSFDGALKWQATNFAAMRLLFLGSESVELRPLPSATAPPSEDNL